MKIPSRVINGVFLLDKDSGASSNRVLQQTKRIFNASKAGHTGSLDPLASGVLPICFGEATKFARFLLDADKTYLVTAQLGVSTATGDAEGEITATKDVPAFTHDYMNAQIKSFLGFGKQIPSMYSALKHNGQPLYKLARNNITVDRPARDICVYSYELIGFSADKLTCKIKCSKGTYIRTLIEDLGHLLGCGAHVTALRRVQSGPFNIENTVRLSTLENTTQLEDLLLSEDTLLHGVPKVALTTLDVRAIQYGQQIDVPSAPAGIISLFSADNTLLGIAEADSMGKITPLRLVAQQQVMV